MDKPNFNVIDKANKPVLWKCALCGFSADWIERRTGDHIVDRAPYVVTLADGKEYGFCSRECVKTKAFLVSLEVLVRQQTNGSWATPPPTHGRSEATGQPLQAPPYCPPPLYPPTTPFKA